MILLIREPLAKIISCYVNAKKTWSRLFWLIFLLAIYLPIEPVIMKFMPMSVKNILETIPELIIYFICFILVGKKIIYKQFKITPIDPILIVAFVCWALILIIGYRDASITSGIKNLESLLRYVPLYYILVYMKISKEQILILLKTILLLGILQGMLCILQALSSDFNSLFSTFDITALESDPEMLQMVLEAGGLSKGIANGTFGKEVNLVAFFFIPTIILLTRAYLRYKYIIPKTKYIIGYLILSFGVFATYKRAGLVLVAILPFLILFYLKDFKQFWKIIWGTLVIGFLGGLILIMFTSGAIDTSAMGIDLRTGDADFDIGYIFQIFTPEYFERASQSSRLWTLQTVLWGVFDTGHWFGFGPDIDFAANTLAELNTSMKQKELILERTDIFEDIYWAAMLLYYGIPGLVFFVLMLQRLYEAGKRLFLSSTTLEYQWLGLVFCVTIIVFVLYSFVERIPEINSFAFYFWLLAGLVVNAGYCQQQKLNNQPSSLS
jgi:hypothetical protein